MLGVPALPGLLWLWMFYRTDRYQPEPRHLVAITFRRGALGPVRDARGAGGARPRAVLVDVGLRARARALPALSGGSDGRSGRAAAWRLRPVCAAAGYAVARDRAGGPFVRAGGAADS